jgi:hypothetical protein
VGTNTHRFTALPSELLLPIGRAERAAGLVPFTRIEMVQAPGSSKFGRNRAAHYPPVGFGRVGRDRKFNRSRMRAANTRPDE